MNAPAYLKIESRQLGEYTTNANKLLEEVKWQSKVGNGVGVTARAITSTAQLHAAAKAQGALEKASLMGIVEEMNSSELLLNETLNHCLRVVWQGLRLGMHVSKLFEEHSGLDVLLQKNLIDSLTTDQKAEMHQKKETSGAIANFVTAYYVLWDLFSYQREKVDGIKMEFEGIPEVDLSDSITSLRCMIYYYANVLKKSGVVKNEFDYLKLSQLYFQAMIVEIKNRVGALRYTEVFTDKNYKLEDTEFMINGFEVEIGMVASRVEFNRVTYKNIVGNHPSKHKARRLVDRLTCYDVMTQRNPMKDLGGLPIIRSGFGTPGTGKGMHISLTATLLEERCAMLGLPFLYNPMPTAMVSTYQGGSTQNLNQWIAPCHDPRRIVYAPIDDAEQHFQNRSRSNLSEGTQGILSAFLPAVEGPQAIWYGNAVMELFTNLPEVIDPAVMSRIQERFKIDGARTWEDFIDQDYLWWERYQKLDSSFIDMEDPKGYNYLDAQKLLASLTEIYTDQVEPKDKKLLEIFHEVSKKYRMKEHAFFAELYRRVQECFPLFSSRDLRNIQKAIDERILDFDFPEDWQTKPEVFYLLDYDGKMKLLKELTMGNMKGLSFAQIRLQEAIRYLDTMVLIQQQGKERAIEEAMKAMEIQIEARQRIMNRSSADGYEDQRGAPDREATN